MNSLEAKFILEAFRHSSEDAKDPFFKEALQQAMVDPELRCWFIEDQKRYRTISRELANVPIPTNLKRNILRVISNGIARLNGE